MGEEMDDDRARCGNWPCDGPASLELSVDVGRVQVALAAAPDGDSTDAAGEVRVEVRHDPTAGPSWAKGLSGLIGWLGAARPFEGEQPHPDDLAAEAVAAAEISWHEGARRLTLRSPGSLPLRMVPLAVTVHAPPGSRLAVRTGAGDVTVTGRAGRADVTTGSGDVILEAIEGASRLRTGSGRIELAAATGRTEIKAGSGDIRVGALDGELQVRAGSGDVAVTDARSGSMELATGSGTLTIGVHPGVAAELDLSSGSGQTRSDLAVEQVAPSTTPTLRVRGRTGSGDVLVTRAVVPA